MSKAECLVKKWSPHHFSTGGYPGEDYKKFQREARAALKELADAAGYTLHRFLPNHYQFSAILQEHETGAYAYVSISDVRFFRNAWATNILYRQMRDEYDWHGGANHYCTLTGLSTALQSLYLKEDAKV